MSSEAFINYKDFASSVTDAPFLVDGPSADIRLPAIKHAVEVGLGDRAIYNSLDHHVTREEIVALKEIGVKSSMLMTYNPRNAWPEGRLDILAGYEGQMGLLEAARQAGIQNTLVDTAVLDVPSIGYAARAVYLVKDRYRLPAGCSPSNAVATWKRVKKDYLPGAYQACLVSSAIVSMMMYANFILYGPIRYAETVYPACAMVDAIVAYTARRLGTRPQVRNHPLFKIF